MPKFYVGLDGQTRYNYSPIGDPINGYFTYNGEHSKRIWRDEITEDIARLAELVNEACQCVRKMNFVDLPMKVFRIESPEPDEATEKPTRKLMAKKHDEEADEESAKHVEAHPAKHAHHPAK